MPSYLQVFVRCMLILGKDTYGNYKSLCHTIYRFISDVCAYQVILCIMYGVCQTGFRFISSRDIIYLISAYARQDTGFEIKSMFILIVAMNSCWIQVCIMCVLIWGQIMYMYGVLMPHWIQACVRYMLISGKDTYVVTNAPCHAEYRLVSDDIR